MKFARLLVPCLLAVCCGQLPVQADHGDLGLAYLYGYGQYGNASPRAFIPAPPYFALHPPVYYGQRYTRPYGVSPFAAWPQLQPNAAYAPQPHVQRSVTICNPYCDLLETPEVVPAPVEGKVELSAVEIGPVTPLVIDNPYFPADEVQYTATSHIDF